MPNRKPQSQESQDAHFNIRVPRSMYDRLQEIAKSEDRSISAEIRRLIRQRVEDVDRDQAAA